MAKKYVSKVNWQDFEKSSLDRQGFVERFRRAELTISGHAREFLTSRWRHIHEVRKPVIIWVLLAVMVLFLTGIDLYFSQKRYHQVAAAPASSFVEGTVGRVTSLNPLFAETEADKLVDRLLFSRLYHYDQSGKLKGDLAKSVAISKDELTYTITIHDNIKWHDGKKLTAEDIKYTIDTFKNQAINSFTGQVFRGVSAKVISEYTIEFSLRSKYAAFLHLLDFAILPKHILDNGLNLRENNFNKMPIGSGRFKFKSFKTATDQDDKQIVSLVLNDDRARDFHLRRFELHLYANQDKLVNGLKNSEVNAIATTTPLATSKIFNDQAFLRKVIPLNNGVFAFFNLAHDTLKDVKLRQVLRTAMNVEYLRQVIFNQDGAVSNFDLPVLKNQLAGLNTIYENNLKTSQLETTMTSLGYIKKSGSWYNKKGEKLKLDIVSVKNTQYQTVAELIAKQLRQFGCEVNLRLVDLSNNDVNVAQEIFKLKNYDILVYEINLGADPDQYGFWHSSQSNQSGLNFSNYSSKIIDDLLVTARLDSDWTLRTAKYNNFLKKWLEDVPAVGLFRSNLYYVKQKGVMGLNSDQLVTPNDRYASILNWSGEETTFYKTP